MFKVTPIILNGDEYTGENFEFNDGRKDVFAGSSFDDSTDFGLIIKLNQKRKDFRH